MMRSLQNGERSRPKSSSKNRNLDFKSARSFVRFALGKKAAVEKTKQDAVHQEFEAVAEICAEGAKLAQNEAAWLAFIESPRWNDVNARPKATGQRDAVRFMLRLYAGTENTKRSSLLWRAVKPYVGAGCVYETVMILLFTAGSFKAAARLNVEDYRSFNDDIEPISDAAEDIEPAPDENEDINPALEDKVEGGAQDVPPNEVEQRHAVEVRLLLQANQYKRISTFKVNDEILIRGKLVGKTKAFAIRAQRFKRVEPKEQT